MGDEDEQAKAKELARDLEALREFVSELEAPMLFTYQIDEREISL